jgi:uncharacterized protein YbjT (DUF2867 family)
MDIVVAGGHGKIALHLLELLAARGDRARGLIRNPDHAADLERIGAEPVVCDLETESPAPHLVGADAIVFAAGAGPGSGDERKRTVDYGGAVKLIESAQALGIDRYVIVSSMGAEDPSEAPAGMRAYQQAKHDADQALITSGLASTVVRPGGLTDEPPTGKVDVAAPSLGRRGTVPRADVAATLLAVLDTPTTAGLVFEVLAGDTPVVSAVAGLPAS